MANVIQIKRSSTPGAVPSSLAVGEMALNRADGELYYLDASDQIVSLLDLDCGEIVDSSPGGGGGGGGGGGSTLSLWRAETLDGNWHWSD
jgi:hypothetical protein